VKTHAADAWLGSAQASKFHYACRVRLYYLADLLEDVSLGSAEDRNVVIEIRFCTAVRARAEQHDALNAVAVDFRHGRVKASSFCSGFRIAVTGVA